MTSLDVVFAGLGAPNSPGDDSEAFSATELSVGGPFRLIKDRQGHPGLLVAVPSDPERILAPLHLKNLEFMPQLRCRIEEADRPPQVGTFACLRLRGGDDTLQRVFLAELGNWIAMLGATPSAHALASAVLRLAELFQAAGRPGKEAVQGVWAELLIIAMSRDPELHARAWHADPTETFDFSFERELLEVKSTSDRLRRHRIALRQLEPPEGTDLRVASVMVEELSSGATVEELSEHVKAQIGAQHRFRIDELVALMLGENWRVARKLRFGYEPAAASLRLFDAAVVPRIEGKQPPELSDIRFTVDLSSIPARSRSDAAGGLFALHFGPPTIDCHRRDQAGDERVPL